jgi:hypothetical protein
VQGYQALAAKQQLKPPFLKSGGQLFTSLIQLLPMVECAKEPDLHTMTAVGKVPVADEGT